MSDKPVRRFLTSIVGLIFLIVSAHAAHADAEADKAAIMDRFHRWTAAFNAKDAGGVCDLFAPDLIYSLPDVVNGSQKTICDNLAKILAREDIELSYKDPDVHEVIVSGDVAVVRLTWTLTVEAKGQKETTTEEGIDIFRRQTDGRWSIARFIAFTTAPNKLLQ